jgi:hypothetical protein
MTAAGRSPLPIRARTHLTVGPFAMTVIVPFLTAARTEYESVGRVLTRLFVIASQTEENLLLARF